MLKNVVLESINVFDAKSTLLIAKTIIIIVARIVKARKENTVVNKNVFKTLFSLALYAIIIEKKMIEINIKNSTTTNIMNNAKTRAIEKLPTIIVDSKIFNVLNIVGDTNLIKSDAIKVKNPKVISIIAVKNFELTSCFFVTGRVWVKYASSPYNDLVKFKKFLKNGWRITFTSRA